MFARKNGLIGLVVVAGTVGSTASVFADEGCSVYRVGVPDFDQVRRPDFPIFGLPGDGRAHCAPTSSTNFIAYLDKIGFPDFMSGSNHDWYSPGGYVTATISINLMGGFMQTTPEDGTTSGWKSGLEGFLNAYYPDEFTVSSWNNGPGGPTPAGMYDLMTDGALCTFCYGRYEVMPASGDLPARRVRRGGHVVSLTAVMNGCSDDPVIGYRDPSSSDSDTAQSPFQTAKWPIRPWTTYWTGNENSAGTFKTNYILDETFPDGRLRAIDGMLAIRAVEGLSVDATQGILSAQKFIDLNMGLTAGVHPTHLLLPAVQRVREAAARMHPMLPQAVVILRGEEGGRERPGIWRANLARKTWDRIADLPDNDVGCFGPDGRFWVFQSGGMSGLDLDGGRPMSCPTRGHTVLACATTDPGVDGDPTDYDLVMVSRNTAGGVFIAAGDVDGDGCGPFEPQPLPIAIPGGCEVAVSPIDGTILMTREHVPGLIRLGRNAAGQWIVLENILPPSCDQPTSPQYDNAGRMIFCCDGTVNVFERNSAGGWTPKADSRWHGFAGGRHFELSRGRAGLADWEGTPGDVNVDGLEEARQTRNGRTTEDCAADFNNDGFVDFFDYDAFVSCFEGQSEGCPANNPWQLVVDINEDGFVDFFDYDAFVQIFERGC